MSNGGIFSFIKNYQKKTAIAALAAVGLILLVVGALSGQKKTSSSKETDGSDAADYARSLEERISELCEEVEGVSDVSVLLTLDGGTSGGTEHVYAENTSGGGDSYVIISVGGEEKTVLVRDIYSSVRGIAVVCRGGDDIAVRRKLSELLSCALGVPLSKISVAGAGK